MGLTSDDAIMWKAEAEDDGRVVARHPNGHRVVFGFSVDGGWNEMAIHSKQWAAEGDHAADLRAAAVAARIAARANGWPG